MAATVIVQTWRKWTKARGRRATYLHCLAAPLCLAPYTSAIIPMCFRIMWSLWSYCRCASAVKRSLSHSKPRAVLSHNQANTRRVQSIDFPEPNGRTISLYLHKTEIILQLTKCVSISNVKWEMNVTHIDHVFTCMNGSESITLALMGMSSTSVNALTFTQTNFYIYFMHDKQSNTVCGHFLSWKIKSISCM